MKDRQIFELLEQPSSKELDVQLSDVDTLGHILSLVSSDETKRRVLNALAGRKKPEKKEGGAGTSKSLFSETLKNRNNGIVLGDCFNPVPLDTYDSKKGKLFLSRSDEPYFEFNDELGYQVSYQFTHIEDLKVPLMSSTVPAEIIWFINMKTMRAENFHRKVMPAYRGVGLGKLLFDLSESFLQNVSMRELLFQTEKIGSALFVLKDNYIPRSKFVDIDFLKSLICWSGKYSGSAEFVDFENEVLFEKTLDNASEEIK